MLLPSRMQPINCDWCFTKCVMSLAEKRFFFKSSSNLSLLELKNDISTPEKSAEASNDIMTINQLLLIFIQFNGCSDSEDFTSCEAFVGSHAVAENNFVGT